MTTRTNFLWIVGLISLAVLSRWLPHPANFSPVMGIALFAGARFHSKASAYAIPLIAMLVSDLWLGWHSTLPFVYFALLLMTLQGWMSLKAARFSWSGLGMQSTLASVVFFVITNFGVWQTQQLYSHDMAGLVACFIAGLPFFPATLASGLVYSYALFALAAVADRTLAPARS